MRITTISVKSVGLIPGKLEEWALYLSEKYGLSKHLCFCGCGESVVLPLERWSHYIDFMDGKLPYRRRSVAFPYRVNPTTL